MQEGLKKMRNQLVLVAMFAVTQGAVAQVRTSPQAFPIQRPVVSLPVVPLVAPAAAAVAIPAAAPAPVFEVTTKDRAIREALSRWAGSAGWIHEPIHWAVDRDFPVSAAAGPEVFGADFKGAVRTLLSSTELTDRPVQPCFYTNHVLRVIPKAELCDKTVE